MAANKIPLLVTVACVVAGVPAARASGPTLQDRQQAACFDDTMRLCGRFVPDIDATKACMKTKKKLVSAECAAFYPAGQ